MSLDLPPWIDANELLEGNVDYLKNAYAKDRITLDELEIGLESVLVGCAVNVPRATPDRIEVGTAWQ